MELVSRISKMGQSMLPRTATEERVGAAAHIDSLQVVLTAFAAVCRRGWRRHCSLKVAVPRSWARGWHWDRPASNRTITP